ncbi:hypothetical protein V6Z11_D05G418300 [Gossypium hirsutum]
MLQSQLTLANRSRVLSASILRWNWHTLITVDSSICYS